MEGQLAIQRKIAKFGPNPNKTLTARVLRKGELSGTVSWDRWDSLLGSVGKYLGLGGTVSWLGGTVSWAQWDSLLGLVGQYLGLGGTVSWAPWDSLLGSMGQSLCLVI